MFSNLAVPTSSREVVSLLHTYGLRPHKGWGQNFLVDKGTAARIVGSAGIRAGEPVMEIGPGLGALTMPLIEKNAQVLALEIDAGLCGLLRDLFCGFPSLRLLQADALKVCWDQLIKSYFAGSGGIKLLSNLPYSISTPLLYRLLEQRFPFSLVVIMLQAEVAQRLLSPPGGKTYGSLSVLSRYYTCGKMLFRVPRHHFWPRPEVDSAVVCLEPRPPILSTTQEELLWKVVRAVFQVRRKTMLNGLLHAFPWEREKTRQLLWSSSIDPDRRPETLSVEEFANLCQMIYNKGSR